MIIHNVEQGSAAWLKLRLGTPTASEFHKIITPAKGDLSTQSVRYAYYLIAESVMGEPLGSIDNLEWVERGKKMEPEAIAQYQFTTECQVERVGFITDDAQTMGASPDRIVSGTRGLLEIKCPAPQTHIGYLLAGPGVDYRPQVQGQLLVAECEWVDFYSFHPRMPPVLIRTYREEAYITKMRVALEQFTAQIAEMTEKVRASGFFEERANAVSIVDKYAQELYQP